MLKVWIRWLRIGVGSVYCVSFKGSFFGIWYLYLWCSQAISVSKDWVGGSMLVRFWRLL